MIAVRVSCDVERCERHFYLDAATDLDPRAMTGPCDERFVVLGAPIIELPKTWKAEPFSRGVRLLCADHADDATPGEI